MKIFRNVYHFKKTEEMAFVWPRLITAEALTKNFQEILNNAITLNKLDHSI